MPDTIFKSVTLSEISSTTLSKTLEMQATVSAWEAKQLDHFHCSADVIDTYSNLPAHEEMFLQVDNAYSEWCLFTFGKQINRNMVLPIKNSLQRIPQPGRTWIHIVDKALINKLGLMEFHGAPLFQYLEPTQEAVGRFPVDIDGTISYKSKTQTLTASSSAKKY